MPCRWSDIDELKHLQIYLILQNIFVLSFPRITCNPWVHTEVIVTRSSVWTSCISSIYKITPCNTHTQITWKERHIAITPSSKNSREILHSRTVLGVADINNGSRDLQAGYQRNSDCLHVWLISRYNLLVNITWRIVFGNKHCVLNDLRCN